MAHKELHFNLDEKFVFESKTKQKLFIALGVGVLLFILGIILAKFGGGHHEAHHALASSAHDATASHDAHEAHGSDPLVKRIFAALWFNNIYFVGISVIGLFFTAYNYVAWAGWSASIMRIPLAMPAFLPIGAILMIIVFAVGSHDIFHWTHSDLYDKTSAHYDKIIAGKNWYLNLGFFIGRFFVFFGAWIFIWMLIKKLAAKQDTDAVNAVKYHDKIIYISAIFLIVFGVSSSMSAWDWTMSIDTHWFSTMFGWYHLASWHVAGLSTILLIILFLKDNGYLAMVNDNHIHDLGKLIFAFSIFWTYVWFGQFILIFYANISEETTYFMDRLFRFDNLYTPFFILNILINFCFPFLLFMSRDAKRQPLILKIGAIGVIIGHWIDFLLMQQPGILKGDGGLGFIELGVGVVYASLFILVVLTALAKMPLIAKNHPMLEESIYHNI
jgi:hypothetical protein